MSRLASLLSFCSDLLLDVGLLFIWGSVVVATFILFWSLACGFGDVFFFVWVVIFGVSFVRFFERVFLYSLVSSRHTSGFFPGSLSWFLRFLCRSFYWDFSWNLYAGII